MNYFLNLRLLSPLLLIAVVLIACSQGVNLSPEETLTTYLNALASGDLKTASALKYDPVTWKEAKSLILFGLFFGVAFLLLKLTHLNPFLALLQCKLIEEFVSPENRKYILLAILVAVIVIAVGAYHLVTGFVRSIAINTDRVLIQGMQRVDTLGSSLQGDEVMVDYVIYFKDGKVRRGKAQVKLQGGMWKVHRL